MHASRIQNAFQCTETDAMNSNGNRNLTPTIHGFSTHLSKTNLQAIGTPYNQQTREQISVEVTAPVLKLMEISIILQGK